MIYWKKKGYTPSIWPKGRRGRIIMPRTEAIEAYLKAQKMGLKEVRERKFTGRNPHPEVLAQKAQDAAEAAALAEEEE
jgi:hypothetical protein